MSDYPADRDLYRTAATPVNPMPERAGVVHGLDIVIGSMGDAAEKLVADLAQADAIAKQIVRDTMAKHVEQHQARAEAKAQRVADETDEAEVISDASELWDALVAAGVTRIVVDSEKFDQFVALLAEPAPTDDHPTLPTTALRTWEGWGG